MIYADGTTLTGYFQLSACGSISWNANDQIYYNFLWNTNLPLYLWNLSLPCTLLILLVQWQHRRYAIDLLIYLQGCTATLGHCKPRPHHYHLKITYLTTTPTQPFPAIMQIVIALVAWRVPLSFRFTKERKGNRHPMAYMPFGGGPRNCIGMRFAIMEAKMEVINMLKRFTILKCAETQVPLKLTRDGIHGPAEGVYVKLIKKRMIYP